MVVPAQTNNVENSADAPPSHGEPFLISPLPLTPLEKFLLQCETPHSPMVIRVILRMSGDCQPDLYVQTLQQAIGRHPLLSSRLQKINRELCWVAGTPEPIHLRHAEGSVFDRECGSVSKSIDLTRSAGLHISIIVLSDGVKVIVDAHHAVTDGNGIRQLITDWLVLYHCAVTGTATKLTVLDPDRLRQRHRFPKPPSVAPISLKDAIRNFLVTIRGRSSRWALRHGKHLNTAEPGQSHCVEEILSNEQCDQLHQRLDAWNVKLNDLVMVCCMSTFAQMAPPGNMNHQITVLNPTDLRLPSDRALPATNRFGFAFMRRTRSECLAPEQMLRGIHEEMTYVRSNFIGVEFIRGLATASKIPGGIELFRRLGLFVPSLQWTCLGDISRGGKRLVPWKDGFPICGNLRLENAAGFAPYAEHVPVSVATCEVNRRLTLTVRSSPRFLTMEETQTFASSLVNLLCTFEPPQVSVTAVTDRKEASAC